MKIEQIVAALRRKPMRVGHWLAIEFAPQIKEFREQYDEMRTSVNVLGTETVPALWENQRKATHALLRQTQEYVLHEASLAYQHINTRTKTWLAQADQTVDAAFQSLRRPEPQAILRRQQALDRLKSARVQDFRAYDERIVHRNILAAGIAFGLALTSLIHPLFGWLCVPPLLYAFRGTFERAFQEVRLKKPGIDVMMTLTVCGGVVLHLLIISSFSALFFLATRKLILMVTEDSRGRMLNVFDAMPRLVWVRVNDIEISLPFREVKAGDTVIVSAGDTVPVDGIITEGMAMLDQHLLTGEASPVGRGVSDRVLASTLVISGKIAIHAEQAGEETTIAKIGQTLNSTIEFKSRVELRAEHLSEATITPTLFTAVAAIPFLGAYGAFGIIDAHFKARMTMLAPVSILNFFQVAFRNGVLFKDGRSLDLLNQVDTLVFDKTGTLTEPQPTVKAVHLCANYTEAEVLRYAAAAESRQTHPIAHAIMQEAERRTLDVPLVSDADYRIGYGLSVQSETRLIQVGSVRFLRMEQIEIPRQMVDIQADSHRQGNSLVLVALDGEVIGAIELMPTIRQEAKTMIETLRKRHHITKTYIISGDHDLPTSVIAETLGIDAYFAEILPEQKADLIRQLQAEGRSVCYIGDGVNDAIALKQSHVSISLRGAATLATDTAQIILLDRGLTNLPFVFELAQRFERNLHITFGMILGSTLVGVGGVALLGWGLWETMLVGLIGFAGGSVTVMLPRLFYRSRHALPLTKL